MKDEEKRRLKKVLRERYELRVRQGMIRFQRGLVKAHGRQIPMTDVCEYYRVMFPILGMHMVGDLEEFEELQQEGDVAGLQRLRTLMNLKFEVFYEIIADCKTEAERNE